MSESRRGRRSKGLKFKGALKAYKGEKSIGQIAQKNGLHPNQVSEWRKQVLEKGSSLFEFGVEKSAKSNEENQDRLIRTIRPRY